MRCWRSRVETVCKFVRRSSGAIESEWCGSSVHRRSGDAAAVVSARPVAVDGHQDFLWHRRLWDVHCPRERQGGQELHVTHEANGRQESRNHRRTEREGRSRGAEGLEGSQRSAVRLLPKRPDHAGCGVAERETKAYGPRYRCRHGGQPVPLRDLPANPTGNHTGCWGKSMKTYDPFGGAGKPGRDGTVSQNRIDLASRRDFLGTAFSAGALVLGVGRSEER